MRKKLLQIILIALLIVIIEIPFINSVKSEGPFENCLQQCQEDYLDASIALLNCVEACAEEATQLTEITGTISTNDETSTDLDIKNPLGETSDISALLSNIINFLIWLAFPVSAILIVYAGYLYLSSAGNEDKVKKAQKALIWALVGFGVILIANGVPPIIEEILSK